MNKLIPILLCIVAAGCITSKGPVDRGTKSDTRIESIEHDAVSLALSVKFKDGSSIRHYDVPVPIASTFKASEYKGAFYRENVEKYYPTEPSLEVNGMKFIPVASKVFDGVTYNKEEQAMYLLGDTGDITKVPDLPEEIYDGFMKARMKGGYYHGFIVDRYEAEVVYTPPPPAPDEPVPEAP